MNPFPDLAPDDYDALLEDIEKRGMVMPIVLDQHGVIIDGHQRQRIAATLGIVDPPTKVVRVKDDAEREQYAIALNVHRRQLSPAQKHQYILRLNPVETGLAQRDIARAVGVSQSTVSEVLKQARIEGVIGADNTPLPPTRVQMDAGLRRESQQRGGRPPQDHPTPPSSPAPTRKPRAGDGPTPRHSDFGKGPPWMSPFIRWCRKALPEQRKHLLRIKEEVDRALALIDGQEEAR